MSCKKLLTVFLDCEMATIDIFFKLNIGNSSFTKQSYSVVAVLSSKPDSAICIGGWLGLWWLSSVQARLSDLRWGSVVAV